VEGAAARIRLTTAIGERVGLVGALSVETAARNLNTRDIDGIVIADGNGPEVVKRCSRYSPRTPAFATAGRHVRQRWLRRNALPNLIRLR
jgi:hypothetical protein